MWTKRCCKGRQDGFSRVVLLGVEDEFEQKFFVEYHVKGHNELAAHVFTRWVSTKRKLDERQWGAV